MILERASPELVGINPDVCCLTRSMKDVIA